MTIKKTQKQQSDRHPTNSLNKIGDVEYLSHTYLISFLSVKSVQQNDKSNITYL